MTFGEKLSVLRKEAKLTQKELAEKLGVSRQAITKWEGDNGVPDIDNVLKISTLFGVSIDELLQYKIEEISLPSGEREEKIGKEDGRLKNVENFVLKRFACAESLCCLYRERKLNAAEWLFDFFLGAGSLEMADIFKTGLVYCFLVVEQGVHKLLLIHKDTMVVKTLATPFTKKTAVIDGYKYKKTKILK